jgi:hypothetical protein
MKKLIIFCDGGLGNRLGVLIGGILTAQKLNRTPILCWPENTWCGCSFNNLFDSKYQIINLDINELFSQHINDKFMIHENQTNLELEQYYPSLDTIDFFKNIKDKDVIYYHNSIPNYFSQEEILNVLSKFIIKPIIKSKVIDFCDKNKINNDTLGIHFRKTDFQSFLNEDDIYDVIIKNPSINYFICSDSLETEEKFNILNNVFTYPKNNYVKKLQETGSWNDLTIDNEGRQFNFNVNRSKESVIEGFIDLLILSKTNIVVESHSTFLKFAKLYKNINL